VPAADMSGPGTMKDMTMEDILRPTADPSWVLAVDGYDPLRERSIESRFATSNGFRGVRAGRSAIAGARWIVPARTYVAGLFDTPDHTPERLVPAADWQRIPAPSVRDLHLFGLASGGI
jgi:hypothetical protein